MLSFCSNPVMMAAMKVAALGSPNTIDNNIEPSDHYDFSHCLKYQAFTPVVIRSRGVT